MEAPDASGTCGSSGRAAPKPRSNRAKRERKKGAQGGRGRAARSPAEREAAAVRDKGDIPPLDEVLARSQAHELRGEASLTLLSGGAKGADALFDELLGEAMPSARRINWSFSEHSGYCADPAARVNLRESLSTSVAMPWLRTACRGLNNQLPKASSRAMKYFQRNVFQILWSDAVYVAGWLDPSATSDHQVGGGTRWAVQPYLDRFSTTADEGEGPALYLYNIVLGQDSGHWLHWDASRRVWDPIDEPPCPLDMPHGSVFTGIGSQSIPEHARLAVRRLFRLP